MNSDLETLLTEWRGMGWNVSNTSGGRLRLTHPRVSEVIHTGPNPTELRSIKNLESLVRRAMRVSGIIEEKPVEEFRDRRKPKKKSKAPRPVQFTPAKPASTPESRDTRPQGFMVLASVADRLKQQQRRELMQGWQLYCLRMLCSEHTNPWVAIAGAKVILRNRQDAQDRVVRSLRAAPPHELADLRQKFRSVARDKAAKRLAVSAIIDKFRSPASHVPYGAVSPAPVVVATTPVTQPIFHQEPAWPEHVRAWRYAALKMRLGGALWSAIRTNHRRTDKMFRQRVLDAYRASTPSEIEVLRKRLRAGEGRSRELARRPAQSDIPIAKPAIPAPVQVKPSPTPPSRMANITDVAAAVREFGVSRGITYTMREPTRDCSVCALRGTCWRARAGLDSSHCRSFTAVKQTTTSNPDPRLSPQLQSMLDRAKKSSRPKQREEASR